MKAKHETIRSELLFYCFVDFGPDEEDRPPQCWIIPSEKIADVLIETHEAWFKQKGKGGRELQPTEMRRLLPDFTKRNTNKYGAGWLDPYHEKWELIAPQTGEFSK
jgi:hypothetical protein